MEMLTLLILQTVDLTEYHLIETVDTSSSLCLACKVICKSSGNVKLELLMRYMVWSLKHWSSQCHIGSGVHALFVSWDMLTVFSQARLNSRVTANKACLSCSVGSYKPPKHSTRLASTPLDCMIPYFHRRERFFW